MDLNAFAPDLDYPHPIFRPQGGLNYPSCHQQTHNTYRQMLFFY